jgi:hypothetical protein
MRIAFLTGLTALALVVPLFGQDQAPATQPGRHPMRGEPPESRPIGLDQMAQRLAERLELTADQQTKYDEILAKYQAQARAQPDQREQQRALAQQYREARQSGDETRAEELSSQMRELRAGHMQLFRDFLAEVEPILNPQQVETVNRFRERFQEGGPRGRGGDVQTILRVAKRLDLNEEQRTKLRQIAANLQPTRRGGNADPQASAEAAKQLKAQILEFLDAKQTAEFERLLAEASQPDQKDQRHRGDRGRKGAPGDQGSRPERNGPKGE